MPIVDTSVAVATPSTTAARITNGQRDGRQGDQEGAADLALRRARHMAEILVPVAPPDHEAQRDRQHDAGQQAAGEQSGDRHAGHRTDGDQHEARRNGLGLRARRGEQRHQIAGLRAARLHLREQHGRDRGHVGGLGARDARHQIHRADQHVMQPAADMAQQACQERHHGARHAGHLDQKPEEDEQRHGQQDEVATCPRPCGRRAP